jgi:hypothetical protein
MGGLVVATLRTLAFLPAPYVAWFRISPLEETNASSSELLECSTDVLRAIPAAAE